MDSASDDEMFDWIDSELSRESDTRTALSIRIHKLNPAAKPFVPLTRQPQAITMQAGEKGNDTAGDPNAEGTPLAAAVASMEDVPDAPIAPNQPDPGRQQQADLGQLQSSAAATHAPPSQPCPLRGEAREQANRNVRHLEEVEKELFARAQREAESNFWDYPAERKAAEVRAQRLAEEQRRDGGMGGTLGPRRRQDWQLNGSAGQGSSANSIASFRGGSSSRRTPTMRSRPSRPFPSNLALPSMGYVGNWAPQRGGLGGFTQYPNIPIHGGGMHVSRVGYIHNTYGPHVAAAGSQWGGPSFVDNRVSISAACWDDGSGPHYTTPAGAQLHASIRLAQQTQHQQVEPQGGIYSILNLEPERPPPPAPWHAYPQPQAWQPSVTGRPNPFIGPESVRAPHRAVTLLANNVAKQPSMAEDHVDAYLRCEVNNLKHSGHNFEARMAGIRRTFPLPRSSHGGHSSGSARLTSVASSSEPPSDAREQRASREPAEGGQMVSAEPCLPIVRPVYNPPRIAPTQTAAVQPEEAAPSVLQPRPSAVEELRAKIGRAAPQILRDKPCMDIEPSKASFSQEPACYLDNRGKYPSLRPGQGPSMPPMPPTRQTRYKPLAPNSADQGAVQLARFQPRPSFGPGAIPGLQQRARYLPPGSSGPPQSLSSSAKTAAHGDGDPDVEREAGKGERALPQGSLKQPEAAFMPSKDLSDVFAKQSPQQSSGERAARRIPTSSVPRFLPPVANPAIGKSLLKPGQWRSPREKCNTGQEECATRLSPRKSPKQTRLATQRESKRSARAAPRDELLAVLDSLFLPAASSAPHNTGDQLNLLGSQPPEVSLDLPLAQAEGPVKGTDVLGYSSVQSKQPLRDSAEAADLQATEQTYTSRIRSLLADTRQIRQDCTRQLGSQTFGADWGEPHYAAEGHAGFHRQEYCPSQSLLQCQDGSAPMAMPSVPLWEAHGPSQDLSRWDAHPQMLAAKEGKSGRQLREEANRSWGFNSYFQERAEECKDDFLLASYPAEMSPTSSEAWTLSSVDSRASAAREPAAMRGVRGTGDPRHGGSSAQLAQEDDRGRGAWRWENRAIPSAKGLQKGFGCAEEAARAGQTGSERPSAASCGLPPGFEDQCRESRAAIPSQACAEVRAAESRGSFNQPPIQDSGKFSKDRLGREEKGEVCQQQQQQQQQRPRPQALRHPWQNRQNSKPGQARFQQRPPASSPLQEAQRLREARASGSFAPPSGGAKRSEIQASKPPVQRGWQKAEWKAKADQVKQNSIALERRAGLSKEMAGECGNSVDWTARLQPSNDREGGKAASGRDGRGGTAPEIPARVPLSELHQRDKGGPRKYGYSKEEYDKMRGAQSTQDGMRGPEKARNFGYSKEDYGRLCGGSLPHNGSQGKRDNLAASDASGGRIQQRASAALRPEKPEHQSRSVRVGLSKEEYARMCHGARAAQKEHPADEQNDRLEDGNWRCLECSAKSFESKCACHNCGVLRKGLVPSDLNSQWRCCNCHTFNFENRSSCFGCYLPRAGNQIFEPKTSKNLSVGKHAGKPASSGSYGQGVGARLPVKTSAKQATKSRFWGQDQGASGSSNSSQTHAPSTDLFRPPGEKYGTQLDREEACVPGQEVGNRSGHFRRAMPTDHSAWAAGTSAHCQEQEPAENPRGQLGRHSRGAGRPEGKPAARVPEGSKQAYFSGDCGERPKLQDTTGRTKHTKAGGSNDWQRSRKMEDAVGRVSERWANKWDARPSLHGAAEEEPKSHWEDLPQELVAEVAKLLPAKSRAAMRRVCSSWRVPVTETISALVLFREPEKLILDSHFAALTRAFPTIKRLELCLCHDLSPWPAVEGMKAITNLTQLEMLRVVKCNVLCRTASRWVPSLAQLPTLTHLNIGVTDRQGVRQLSQLTQLTNLDLRHSTWLDADYCKGLSRLTGLQVLNMQGCRGSRSYALAVVLKHTTQLTQLNLGSCQMVSAKALATLDGLQQLQDLNLKECQTLSMDGFSSLVGASAVTKLDLGYCPTMHDAGATKLAEATGLRELNLSGCINLGNEGLAALAALTNLRSLNLAQCTGLRDDCRFALRKLPHLTSLDISQCPQLGEAVNELQWIQGLEIRGRGSVAAGNTMADTGW